jgi:hypothetical protein
MRKEAQEKVRIAAQARARTIEMGYTEAEVRAFEDEEDGKI